MRFALGQCVNHRSGNMPSIVVGRSRTERGNEQYHVRQIELGPRRYHVMSADVLVPMSADEAECDGCRLRHACPLLIMNANPAAAGWVNTMAFDGLA
jgi:hypothetical protein